MRLSLVRLFDIAGSAASEAREDVVSTSWSLALFMERGRQRRGDAHVCV
jgi:hypothetical protein